jgi:hypothetical protein
MGMVKDAFTGDIISDEEYARRLASRKYGGSLDNPYIMEPTKVAASRLPLADSFIKPSYSGFGESRQKAIEESPPEAIEEKDSPRSLLSRMGGYAKDNPELIAQIAQLGGGLVANYAQGKAQEKADKKTSQRVARSNLISALSGGKIRPGVAEEVADSGGLLKTIGQVVQGGGKIAENEMGRRLAEETRLRGEKMEDEELALKKLEYEAERAAEKQGTEAEQRETWAKTYPDKDPGEYFKEKGKVGTDAEINKIFLIQEKALRAKDEIFQAQYKIFDTNMRQSAVTKERQDYERALGEIISGFHSVMGEDSTGAGDIAMIKALAKLQDPGSVIRETEFEILANVLGTFNKWGLYFTKGMFEGEKLTNEGRIAILELGIAAYQRRTNEINRHVDGKIDELIERPVNINDRMSKEQWKSGTQSNRLRHFTKKFDKENFIRMRDSLLEKGVENFVVRDLVTGESIYGGDQAGRSGSEGAKDGTILVRDKDNNAMTIGDANSVLTKNRAVLGSTIKNSQFTQEDRPPQ